MEPPIVIGCLYPGRPAGRALGLELRPSDTALPNPPHFGMDGEWFSSQKRCPGYCGGIDLDQRHYILRAHLDAQRSVVLLGTLRRRGDLPVRLATQTS